MVLIMLSRYIIENNNKLIFRFKMGVFLTEILPIRLSAYRQSRLLDISDFYLPERNVYNLIIEAIETVIPYPNSILVEPVLYEIDNGNQRSDIAIKKMASIHKKRKDKEIEFLLFMEIKTVFSGENLIKDDIDVDINKLRKCYQQYNNPICLFVLIIATPELKNIKKNEKIREFLECHHDDSVKLTGTNDQDEQDFTIFIFSITNDSSSERDIHFVITEQ